mgnify:CR=1 FL=1
MKVDRDRPQVEEGSGQLGRPSSPQNEGVIPLGGGLQAFSVEEWDPGPGDNENGEPEICVRGMDGPYRTLYVEMIVGGCPQMAVIDTGAQATLVSDAMAGRMGVPSRVLADLPRVKLRGFGQDGTVEGKRGLRVTFKVGSKEMEWPVLVAPIREEVLIGLEIGRAHV